MNKLGTPKRAKEAASQATWEIYGANPTRSPKRRQSRAQNEAPGCRDYLIGLLVFLAAAFGLIWFVSNNSLPQFQDINTGLDGQNAEASPGSQASGAPTAYARIMNGTSSSESFYLDGNYTPRITVVDSEENCVLSLFARKAGDGYGTAIFNDLVIGNVGSFPGPYRQTFTWDSVSFSGETVRFYNDGGCDEVQLFMNRE
jgi:hypothetical protein